MSGEPKVDNMPPGSTALTQKAKGLNAVIGRAHEIETERAAKRPNESRPLTRKHAVAAAMLEHQEVKLKKAEADADHDPLTHLLNRRGFLERFDKDNARISRANFGKVDDDPSIEKSSIFFLDLNKFKLVNDASGHEAGDKLLKKLAGILRSSVRPTDLLARWGGDEFIAVLSGNDLAAAKMYWENNLMSRLAESGITVSAGLSEVDPNSPLASLALADELQLMAKGISRENDDSTQLVPAEQ